MSFWKQLSALRNISPDSIRREADQGFSLALTATRDELQAWVHALIPSELTERKRDQALRRLFRVPVPLTDGYRKMLADVDVVLATPAAAPEIRPGAPNYILLPSMPSERRDWPSVVIEEVWERRPELRLALARHYVALRDATVSRIIAQTAKENALFSIVTALPDVVPSAIELPWAIGEFASDTAFITANQIRMAFQIAAASDSPVGWREQKGQVASIAGSAFGWRAIARELAGKAPAGLGLVAKGLIAYAGTVAVGRGLDQFHRIGRNFTRNEKRRVYEEAYHGGRRVVEDLARKFIPRRKGRAVPQVRTEAGEIEATKR